MHTKAEKFFSGASGFRFDVGHDAPMSFSTSIMLSTAMRSGKTMRSSIRVRDLSSPIPWCDRDHPRGRKWPNNGSTKFYKASPTQRSQEAKFSNRLPSILVQECASKIP